VSTTLFAAIEPSAGGSACEWDREMNERWWEQLPAGLRAPVIEPDMLPAELAPALRVYDSRGQRRMLHLDRLPRVLRTEFAWAIFRVLDLGGKLSVAELDRLSLRLASALERQPELRGVESLMERPAGAWDDVLAREAARAMGRIESARGRTGRRNLFQRLYTVLWFDYDQRPWWRRDIWWPRLDARIPQRRHEPTKVSVRWFDLEPAWLREGIKFYGRVSLETEQLVWSTIARFPDHARHFARFLGARGIDEPRLADDPGGVRQVALDYAGFLHEQRSRHGERRGQPLGPSSRKHAMGFVEGFYAFMEREQEAAARELGEPRWLQLGAPHSRLYRAGDKPKVPLRARPENVIDEPSMKALMSGIGLLGEPIADGGRGDPQAMRILALLAKTGRRQSEIRLLDFDPLEPLLQTGRDDAADDGVVARLRYQQTKIAGAPNTIFADEEIVAIVEAQQQWTLDRMRENGMVGIRPKYLFLAAKQNRRGDLAYRWPHLYKQIRWLIERLDVRDDRGRVVAFTKTHRFRHTRATQLINLGVPLHVVQRHFGHLSPKMTMHYAQTLEETHRAEFLRYRKITASGHELDLPAEDLYDLLSLDQRTDRVLPNGLCMLPPRQTCTRGNACLTCDQFVTDASHLADHEEQHVKLVELIERRDAAHRQKTGRPMSDDNIWKAERLKEKVALKRIIAVLKDPRLDANTGVRGPATETKIA